MLPRRHIDAWERSFVCLELDMFTGAGIKKLVLRPGEAEAFTEGPGRSTASGKISVEGQALRSCLQNALVTSSMYLLVELNRTRLATVVCIGRILRTWRGEQSCKLRSVQRAVEWVCQEVAMFGFSDHANQMFAAPAGE